jgi:uncharacterized metal-binding protein
MTSGDDRHITLLTCSGISHTGRLTAQTGTSLRCRHPGLIGRHLQLTNLKNPLDVELQDGDYLIAVDGCDECCAKKRLDSLGTIPDSHIVATREGITKRGMEEARYDEIEVLSRVIIKAIRK